MRDFKLNKMLKPILLISLATVGLAQDGNAKKGVCFTKATFKCGDFNVLNGVSWWYNWAGNGDMGCGRQEPGFVPMFWNDGRLDDPVDGAYILGFNEPNFGEQANMTPERAAQAWKKLEAKYPDRKLVSPSAAPGGNNMDPIAWFDQFFAACKPLGGCRVDYLATHSYSGSVDHDMKFLKELYDRYGKKVWLTEFAVPSTEDEGKVFDYLGSMLWHLHEADYVFRFSWFLAKFDHANHIFGDQNKQGWYLSPVNSLFVPGTSTLTKLGQFYNDYQHKNGKK